MMPKISAKFRRHNGVPYAIEQFTGKQFRCRHCNILFYEEKKLIRHLETVAKNSRLAKIAVDRNVPKLNNMLKLKLGYMYDITDYMRRQNLKLKKNDVYDGITFNEINQKEP